VVFSVGGGTLAFLKMDVLTTIAWTMNWKGRPYCLPL